MKKLRLVAATTLAIVWSNAALGQAPDTLRVLFVGNSYTYYNNLPQMVASFAAAHNSGSAVEVAMVVQGGATLLEHSESERTLQAIRGGDWDVVVLQAQSTLGSTYLVDGQFRVGDPSVFYRGAAALTAEVKAAGARPVLLQHWSRRGAPSQDHRRIAYSIMHVGRELGAAVAPVGSAWEEVLESGPPDIDLYARDGSHPGPAGSFLAAAVLYEVVTGQDPIGLPGEVRGPPVDLSSEEVVLDSVAVLVRLTADQAEGLEKAAHAAVQRLRLAGGYLDLQDPGPPDVPEIPTATPVDPAQIDGRWSGPLSVYPYPGTLVLTISRDTRDWSLKAEVTFGGQPDDIIIDVETFSVSVEGIRFVDPNGPNGGEVRYQGVWTEDGLSGVAEIIVPGAPIYGIGAWTLKREPLGGVPGSPTTSNTPVAAAPPLAASPFGTPAFAGVGNR